MPNDGPGASAPGPAPGYVRYAPSVERVPDDEAATTAEVLAAYARLREFAFEKHRHGLRDAHAKSHGVVRGELTVDAGLPPELAQGLFAAPRAYPVIARYSTAPPDILPDGVSAFRGLGLKVIGVEGEKLLPALGDAVTQDFALINHPAFPNRDLKTFLRALKPLEKFAHAPEEVQEVVTGALRAGGNLLRKVGADAAGAIGQATAMTHIMGDAFFTAAPLRYGDYVAKLAVVPVAAAQQPLRDARLDPGNPSAVRDAVVAYYDEHAAEYEVRVQLCTSLETMPVEDASVEWPEAESPYRRVARLVFPAQPAFGAERRVYADDVLTFSPWHGLAAHQPLGGIMRVRRPAYEASSDDRHARNARARAEPRSIDELPD